MVDPCRLPEPIQKYPFYNDAYDKVGEVANRIITVGDVHRAKTLAKLLDAEPKPFEMTSKRLMTTITGCYKGVPVSIVAIGMGLAVTEMLIREIRAVTKGELLFIRFGSCGSVQKERGLIGQVVVAEASVCVLRNHDHFVGEDGPPYLISRPVPSDQQLQQLLEENLKRILGTKSVETGLNASTDYFYASQGRKNFDMAERMGSLIVLRHSGNVKLASDGSRFHKDPFFDDKNDSLVTDLCSRYPSMLFFEMENYLLFHMAECSRRQIATSPANSVRPPLIRAAACAMVFAQRASNDFITPEDIARLESSAGLAVMEAIRTATVQNEMDSKGMVWEL
ncbi:hypothetical protein HDU93_006410 [Gonapodya sp. JEL0774]|nr:hypothetical protein HDU93_006410 [Gonapodya sp. JEL0774]